MTKALALLIAVVTILFIGLESLRLTLILSKAANKRAALITASNVPYAFKK